MSDFKKMKEKVESCKVLEGNTFILLMKHVTKIFQKQPNVLVINSPCIIHGNTHGYFYSLLESLVIDNFFTNGNYIDYGIHSIECLQYLLILKAIYPKSMYLLRGNHECYEVSVELGFFETISKTYSKCGKKVVKQIQKMCLSVFKNLSLCAVLQSKDKKRIFCVHGGISKRIKYIEQINQIKTTEFGTQGGIATDLMWSKPESLLECKYQENIIGCSFGGKAVLEFNKRNKVVSIICSNGLIMKSYKYFFKEKNVVLVTSTPNFRYKLFNLGCVMDINKDFEFSPYIFKEDSDIHKRILLEKGDFVNRLEKYGMLELDEKDFKSFAKKAKKLRQRISKKNSIPQKQEKSIHSTSIAAKSSKKTRLKSPRKPKNISKQPLDYIVSKVRLGKGTFGSVFKGTLRLSKRNLGVAIKIIDFDILKKKLVGNSKIDEEQEKIIKENLDIQKAKVATEIQTLMKFQHPNLLKYYGHDIRGEKVYIITDRCTEGTLMDILSEYEVNGRLKICKPLFMQIVKGIHFLHSRNIVHRDIKPQNILITLDSNDQQIVKIADLGIVKYLNKEGRETSLTAEVRTEAYSPPELEKYFYAVRLHGRNSILTKKKWKKVHPKAIDIYAFGLSCLHVLVGAFPKKIYDDNLQPIIPSQVSDRKLKDFMMKCIQYYPKDRPTIDQLLKHKYFKEK